MLTWPLLVLDEATEAWLLRALLSAAPVTLDTKVVVPTVVSKVVDWSVLVETMAEVRVVSGTEVAPATPLMPEMIVSPVTVLTTEPLVKTEVKVLVVMGVASPLLLGSEKVDTEVVTKVDPPVVTVVTTAEVETGLPAAPEAPEALWIKTLIHRIPADHEARSTYGDGGGRGNVGGNTRARAEAVAPADGHVGLVDTGAGLNGTVMDAVAKVLVLAQAGDVAVAAAKLGSLCEHVGAAGFLSSRPVSS